MKIFWGNSAPEFKYKIIRIKNLCFVMNCLLVYRSYHLLLQTDELVSDKTNSIAYVTSGFLENIWNWVV